MTTYREFYRRSIDAREGFWAEQAGLVHWHKPHAQVLDYRRPPFAWWFVGGKTNLCYNALDRHLASRGDQRALVYISSETGEDRSFSYRELHLEVQRSAAMMRSLGVGKGDRVIVYMPMIPEAAFVILACARIGAIHSVVFGGFAAASLAARIDDERPKLMVTADGGSRMGKGVNHKALVDESIRLAKPTPVVISPRAKLALCLCRLGSMSGGIADTIRPNNGNTATMGAYTVSTRARRSPIPRTVGARPGWAGPLSIAIGCPRAAGRPCL